MRRINYLHAIVSVIVACLSFTHVLRAAERR